MATDYEVLIVGSGIAGSTLGLVLGKAGVRTLVIEKGAHPRFAIGESTLPTTTLLMRRLARDYGVSELEDVCHYFGLRQLGLTAYPKQHFWFGYHRPGKPLADGDQLLFDTIRPPIGPDVHFLRSDVDAFLTSRLSKYGVDYSERTEISEFEQDGDAWRVGLKTHQGDRTVRVRLTIDCSGHASYFARRFGLRDDPPRLTTNTRSLFSHFRGVRPLEEAIGRPHRYHRDRDRGTVHHCFDGGWLWVIPFDNGVTSVGLQLDNARFPLDPNVAPEDELRDWIARFPTMQAHLGGMQPIRPYTRTGRVQFTASQVVGVGFILAPHAAGFIDPLYSTGMLLTMAFINRMALLLRSAMATGDFSREQFLPIESLFFEELAHMDRIVGGTFASFRDFATFKQYWRTFAHASAVQYFTGAAVPTDYLLDHPLLYGSGYAGWRETVRQMHAVVCDTTQPVVEAAARLKSLMDEVPHAFRRRRYETDPSTPVHLDTWSDRPYVIRHLLQFIRQDELKGSTRLAPAVPMLLDVLGMGLGRPAMRVKYYASKLRGTGYHRWIDRLNGAPADVPQFEELLPKAEPVSIREEGAIRRFDPPHSTPHAPHDAARFPAELEIANDGGESSRVTP
jgi:FADH2 O2-dependent halogenase